MLLGLSQQIVISAPASLLKKGFNMVILSTAVVLLMKKELF